jgi:hypothetical protein
MRGKKAGEMKKAMERMRRREPRPRSLRRQRDVLCDVMLSAGACETWLTLVELARLTHFGEASISAQLRHLRKPEYGGFAVEKRTRENTVEISGVEHGPVWEYRLRRGMRVKKKPAVVEADDRGDLPVPEDTPHHVN